ncbi:MAG: hypothetical protein QJR08_04370 [Bacillota bacterium]|nr:hypothetical protein [Bacillota bacterium]
MVPSKILFVSAVAESTDLAIRCQQEGHQVRWYVHSLTEQRVGDGLLHPVRDWRAWVDWADLVVFDDVEQDVGKGRRYGGGAWASWVRRVARKPVIGGSPETDRMENDRIFGQKVAANAGIPVVPMVRFAGPSAFAKAQAFVKREGGAWALKHNNQVSRDLATVQWDPQGMLDFLGWLQDVWKDLAHGQEPDFVLQEAHKGVEIAVTGLFDGQTWQGAYVNQEIKKLMSGDEGPSTGQMGEMGFAEMGPLWREALLPLTRYLSAQGYHGCIDLNMIATEDRIVPLEWTARFGYPTVSSIVEALDMPVGEALWTLATGQGRLRWHDGYVATVVVASGPFPREDPDLAQHLTLLPDQDLDWQRVHLNEVRRVGKRLESAGSMGYLAVVTHRGRGPAEARMLCYRQVDKLKVLPFRIVRRDIGDQFIEDLPKLKAWGWVA